MKVLMLTPVFIEGLGYQENALADFYHRHGHEVHVVTSTHDSIFEYASGRHDPRVPERSYRTGVATLHRRRYAMSLVHFRRFGCITGILQSVKPDLIFVHGITADMRECVRHLRGNPECRMILDYHGDFSNSGRGWLSRKILHGVFRKRILDRARPYLSRIFPITPASERFLNKIYGVPHREMELLPLGADLELGRRIRESGANATLRGIYGIAKETTVIFTGGKLVPLRRTECLIEAFKRLPEGRAFLVIAGEATADHSQYKSMLERLSAGRADVKFTGWLEQEDIFRHLDLADIAVFPAGQSVLWQQAVSMGLPLVIGDIAGGDQDVSYMNLHENIIVADGSRPLDLALLSVLERLMEDDALRRKMAEGSARVARELLDWNATVKRTLRFSPAADPGICARTEPPHRPAA